MWMHIGHTLADLPRDTGPPPGAALTALSGLPLCSHFPFHSIDHTLGFLGTKTTNSPSSAQLATNTLKTSEIHVEVVDYILNCTLSFAAMQMTEDPHHAAQLQAWQRKLSETVCSSIPLRSFGHDCRIWRQAAQGLGNATATQLP